MCTGITVLRLHWLYFPVYEFVLVSEHTANKKYQLKLIKKYRPQCPKCTGIAAGNTGRTIQKNTGPLYKLILAEYLKKCTGIAVDTPTASSTKKPPTRSA
jgi:hypothetical protein